MVGTDHSPITPTAAKTAQSDTPDAATVNVPANAPRREHEKATRIPSRHQSPPDPGPAIQLRIQLAYSRDQGLDFTTAWGDAITTVTAPLTRAEHGWIEAFAATVDAWRSAYDGEECATTMPFIVY